MSQARSHQSMGRPLSLPKIGKAKDLVPTTSSTQFDFDPAPPKVTVAFHFRYIMPGEWVNSDTEAVKLVLMVMKALSAEVASSGQMGFRAGKLFYTQHLDDELMPMWREASRLAPVIPAGTCLFGSQIDHVPLDRVFVVSVSVASEGPVSADRWADLVRAEAGDRLLFTLVPSPAERGHRAMYFGGWSTCIGTLVDQATFIQEFGAIEYEPELSSQLDRAGLRARPSREALSVVLDLLQPSLGAGKTRSAK